jgi:hypothetical protein
VVLRSLLRTKPFLRRCLVRCRHCGIFFLIDRGNGGRKDLGCPFGCQRAHGQRQSTIRSVAYYRTSEGKRKKRDLNQKRRRRAAVSQAPPAPPPASSPVPPAHVPSADSSAPRWNLRVLPYVRRVVSLIEGRRVSRTEILQMLEEVLRQHTHARRRSIDHTVAWLHENPP